MSIEVKDVMGHVAIAVDQDATFSEIVRAMGRYAVGTVTVIDADRRAGLVRGCKEEGTTAPFDVAMLNDIDRYHLVMDVVDRVPGLAGRSAHLRQHMADARLRARAHTREHGEDPAEIRDWAWP